MTAAAASLRPGFADPVFGSQRVFRGLMTALSRPGRVVDLATTDLQPPAAMSPAMAALALTLIDADTPVWFDAPLRKPETEAYFRFHCGAPLVDDPAAARFVFVGAESEILPLDRFDCGHEQYPDRSATLVVELPGLAGGPEVRLAGPGIAGTVEVSPSSLPAAFWTAWAVNAAVYPLGVDLFFTSGCQVLGLPRSIRAEAAPCT